MTREAALLRVLRPRLDAAMAALGHTIDDEGRRLLILGVLEDLQRSIQLEPALRQALYDGLWSGGKPEDR